MFSAAPEVLGKFHIDCPEFTYHLYLPIKMADSADVRIPQHLHCFWPLVGQVMSIGAHAERYMYMTVKHMHVQRGGSANRPGWHIDGYGSDDENFIWSNRLPTEFVCGYFDLSDDHDASLLQMSAQAVGRSIITHEENTLLALDSTNVHRVAECHEDMVRTFCKISTSSDRYDLRGNSHNYLFGYDWPMVDRQMQRNHPVARSATQGDSHAQ